MFSSCELVTATRSTVNILYSIKRWDDINLVFCDIIRINYSKQFIVNAVMAAAMKCQLAAKKNDVHHVTWPVTSPTPILWAHHLLEIFLKLNKFVQKPVQLELKTKFQIRYQLCSTSNRNRLIQLNWNQNCFVSRHRIESKPNKILFYGSISMQIQFNSSWNLDLNQLWS